MSNETSSHTGSPHTRSAETRSAETRSAETRSAETSSAGNNSQVHHEELSTLTLPVVNFIVFLAVLVWVFKKKLQPMMVLRAQNFNATVARVAEAEKKFQEQVDSLRFQLARIEDEEKQVIETFAGQGMLSAESITKQGLDEISGMQAEAAQTKINLVNQLEEDVRRAISDKAMKLAAEKLSSALTPEMDKSLRAKVLESI